MKRFIQNVLVATIPALLCLELLGFLSRILEPRLYEQPGQVAAIGAIDSARFAAFAANVQSKTLGWDHVHAKVGASNDCEGGRHVATYDGRRARIHKDYDAARVAAILVGDSYVHGDEVGDEETIAASLWRDHGIMAANLGVGGFSPLQSVLKAKERRADYPGAKVIVLGLMYENIRRNVNGYLPAIGFTEDDQSVFALRPYMRDGTVVPLPPAAIGDAESFKSHALAALRSDYWARPAATFPYSISLIRALTSNSGMRRIEGTVYKAFDRQFASDYRDARLTEPLFLVVRDFFEWAASAGIRPVAIFFPQNRKDRSSAASWIQAYAARLPANGVVADAPIGDVDWDRFNRRTDLVCHPDGYGYAAIARGYAATIKPLLTP
ncbi:MAG: hypothetical protein JNK67_06835 [Alphaproteobacteria bacterium]|nr:hypothetical protein [Alphaproteobacteria bacterium]